MSLTQARSSASLDAPLQVAGATDRGRVRERNEDAIHIETGAQQHVAAHGTLCAVADGMGGHAAGAVASHVAVDTLRSAFYHDGKSLSGALGAAIQAANHSVWAQAQARTSQRGMGSTLTAAAIRNGQLAIGHVGDSRAYLVSNGRITQVTADHSWVGEQVAAGKLTPEQARSHPQRNVIRRALGYECTVEVDVFRATFDPGDMLLLCSDGLTTVVSDEEIEATMLELPPEQAVDQLIRQANARGAPDNVSVIVAHAAPAPRAAAVGQRAPTAQPGKLSRRLLAGGVGLGLVLVAAAGVAVSRTNPPGERSTSPDVATPVAVVAQPTGGSTSGVVAPIQATSTPATDGARPASAATPSSGVSAPALAAPSSIPSPSAAATTRTGRISDDREGGVLRDTAARTGTATFLYYDTQLRILGEQNGESYQSSTLWYRVQVLTGDAKDKTGFVHSSTVEINR